MTSFFSGCGFRYVIQFILFFQIFFWFLPKIVKVPVVRVPVISASRTLRTGEAPSFQAPWYPGDWWDSVLSDPQVPWELAGLLNHFSPQVPRGLTGPSPFRPAGTLRTGGTQSSQLLGFPGDSRGSVLSTPQVPWGVGSPIGLLLDSHLTESRGLVRVL